MKYTLLLLLMLLPVFLKAQNQGTIEPRASGIADSVIAAMGGKSNWDNVHYIKWNFFGRRMLLWDKWTGNVRIEMPSKNLLILTNINTRKGHVYRSGKELMQPDSNAYFMDRGFKIWANDSYWFIMPFKLKDPGVNLSYKGEVTDPDGKSCYLLELTFNKVGVTPENKYHVYVDRKNFLVTWWEYFEKFTDTEPGIRNPWMNYNRYGAILLSGDRGPEEGSITDIAVMEVVDEAVFEKP